MVDENANVDIVCMLQWFGPFSGKEDCKDWVKSQGVSFKEFNFYIICGKRPGRGVRKDSFYCGITRQNFIFQRFDDPNHPSNKLNNLEIWIARFSDEKLRLLTSDNKLRPEMNIYIEEVEHGLINYLSQLEQTEQIEFNIVNDRKRKSQPKESLCIINQWYDKFRNNRINRVYRAIKWFPDIIYYDEFENNGNGMWKISSRLKLLKR